MLDRFNQRGKGDQGRKVKHVRPGERDAKHVGLAHELPADERLDHHGGVYGGEFQEGALANLAGTSCSWAEEDAGEEGRLWQGECQGGTGLCGQSGGMR